MPPTKPFVGAKHHFVSQEMMLKFFHEKGLDDRIIGEKDI